MYYMAHWIRRRMSIFKLMSYMSRIKWRTKWRSDANLANLVPTFFLLVSYSSIRAQIAIFKCSSMINIQMVGMDKRERHPLVTTKASIGQSSIGLTTATCFVHRAQTFVFKVFKMCSYVWTQVFSELRNVHLRAFVWTFHWKWLLEHAWRRSSGSINETKLSDIRQKQTDISAERHVPPQIASTSVNTTRMTLMYKVLWIRRCTFLKKCKALKCNLYCSVQNMVIN